MSFLKGGFNFHGVRLITLRAGCRKWEYRSFLSPALPPIFLSELKKSEALIGSQADDGVLFQKYKPLLMGRTDSKGGIGVIDIHIVSERPSKQKEQGERLVVQEMPGDT